MHSKLFLENNKKKISCSSFIFQPSAAQNALNRLGPASARSPRPHPGRNLGLGRQTAPRARARLGLDLAQGIAAVRVDPTAERLFRADQNAAAADALETLGIRLFPSLSPRCLPLLSRSGDGHRRAAASEEKPGAGFGAVAGPLAGARAPQRVSTPPSSGLAAALSWPSPALSWPSPGASARFLLQRRRKNRCASSSSSAPVVVYPR